MRVVADELSEAVASAQWPVTDTLLVQEKSAVHWPPGGASPTAVASNVNVTLWPAGRLNDGHVMTAPATFGAPGHEVPVQPKLVGLATPVHRLSTTTTFSRSTSFDGFVTTIE